MKMEGRGLSELYRNTSEELFIRTMMENSIVMPAPTIDMLGFRNLSQSFRTDSEELFKSWLTCGENNGSSPSMAANRTRQASRRISTEIPGLPNQQAGTQKRKGEDALLPQTNSSANEPSSGLNQQSLRNTAGKEMQAANFYLAKAWFHSSQPMTRSRSSELRRRYVAMQNSQLGVESGIETFKQEFGNTNGFTDLPRYEMPNQLSSFVSPSNSSSSTFEAQNVDAADKISSVVSMLKGTLERKKLSGHCHTTIEALEDSSIYGAHEVLCNSSLNHMLGGHIYEKHEALEDAFFQVNDTGVFQAAGGSLDAKLDDVMAPTSLIQMGAPSQELSQSESSVVPLVISTGFDICDGSSNTYQAQNGRSTENGSSTRDIRERTYENSKDNQKKGGLVRYGSLKSSQSVENGDPTKKRRVERSRNF
ncbi:PREDICTED: uncharacterized protein LOC109177441 isoform X2 [Ipomoea nil]|uniref:uncharacterized protein LOC109177441 isoform X2 n=1 Tax=Ipomoea nil TaxID=35883 RepID=UPI000901EB6E|nr:PREDICTED: uncharacterized protein LOC109177441 isoform X2 [Ipomoea nil]